MVRGVFDMNVDEIIKAIEYPGGGHS